MKNALVTGGNGGIGTAIVHALLKEGYNVIVCYAPSDEEKIPGWISEVGVSDKVLKVLALDISNAEACRTVLTKIICEHGNINVLVNNAGITRDTTFKRMTAEQWHEVINVNLSSLYHVTNPLFNSMCENGSGRIINISSVNGLKGQFGQVNYSAAKAGMIGFTKALALEAAKYGVTVNAIAPGYTGTPMVEMMNPDVLDSIRREIPMQRLATPQEIAAGVIYLASDAAAYVTGETLSINGGLYMH